MIKLIPGKKGSGKTKLLISEIQAAEKTSNGNVVAIQLGSSLNINISHKVRLINIEDYKINCYNDMFGFIAGILASDYDCTHIFVDGLLRIVGRDFDKVGEMFARIASISEGTNIVFTISADVSELPDEVKKYL